MRPAALLEFVGAPFRAREDYPCWCGESRAAAVCGQWLAGRRFMVLRCAACGTRRILPRAVSDETAARRLYNTRANDNCLGTRGEDEREAAVGRMLERLRRAGIARQDPGDVLDVGCADGEILARVCRGPASHGEGVDLDAGAVELARRRHPRLTFHPGLLSEARLERPAYDLVLASALLEHVPDPSALLKAIRPLVKDGGEVFLLTPNADSLNFRWLRSWWRELLAVGEHVFLFTPDSLRRCARESGFFVSTVFTDFDPPAGPVRIRSVRDAVVWLWARHCRAVKGLARRFAGPLSGDLLCARLVPGPAAGSPEGEAR